MPKVPQTIPIGLRALQYIALQEKEKLLEKEKKVVREELEVHLKEKGKKNEKGHIIVITEHNGEKCEVKNECRVFASLVTDAEKILKKALPEKVIKKIFETKTETIFRQDVLTVFIQDGTIPKAVAEKLFESKNNYAFKVKRL